MGLVGETMKDLAAIYEGYKDYDAGGDKGTAHSYIDLYAMLLNPTKSLLEVGVHKGLSLAMFTDYFDGPVVGLDVNLNIFQGHGNALLADATNPGQVANALGNMRFDYVIDDGSHKTHDQIATLEVLWPYLLPGGIFFIEDIEGDQPLAELVKEARKYGRVTVYDYRRYKGRYDDLLITIDKGGV